MGEIGQIVPKGQNERSQAIYCVEAVKKRIRPVGHGVMDFLPELLVRKRVSVPRGRACPSRTRDDEYEDDCSAPYQRWSLPAMAPASRTLATSSWIHCFGR